MFNKALDKNKVAVKEATLTLLKMFETGRMPDAIALSIISRKAGDDQPSFHWSIGNQILMYAQGTTDARGYSQWKEVGRHVKKGASAIMIIAPITRKLIIDTNDGSKEKVVITGFKPIPVFRYEDTEGKNLDKPNYAPPSLPPFWDVAQKLGVKVSYTPVVGSYYGKFNKSNKEITLCSQDAFVYFHELAHAVHASFKELQVGQNPEQEIVAETSAAVLCQLQGITGFESQAYNYIKTYSEKMNELDVVKCIMRLLNDVEQIVNKILEIAETDKPKAHIA